MTDTTCPKCGAAFSQYRLDDSIAFSCGSMWTAAMQFILSPRCVDRQLAQQAERIAELEAAIEKTLYEILPGHERQHHTHLEDVLSPSKENPAT